MPVSTRYWLFNQSQLAEKAEFNLAGHREILVLSPNRRIGRIPEGISSSITRVPRINFTGSYLEVTRKVVEDILGMVNYGVLDSGMTNGTLYLVQFGLTRWGDTDIDWTIGAAYTMNTLTPQFRCEEVANSGFDIEWVKTLLGYPVPELKPVIYLTRFERILQGDS